MNSLQLLLQTIEHGILFQHKQNSIFIYIQKCIYLPKCQPYFPNVTILDNYIDFFIIILINNQMMTHCLQYNELAGKLFNDNSLHHSGSLHCYTESSNHEKQFIVHLPKSFFGNYTRWVSRHTCMRD